MKPRIIVCGLGLTGYKIFCLLKQQGAVVVGVNDVPIEGDTTAQAQSCPMSFGSDSTYVRDIVIGNLRSPATLIEAGVREAHTLVLATSDDALNLAILTQARVLNPRIRIINRLFNTSLGDRLDHTLPDHTSMSVAALSAPVFAFAALGNKAIGQLQLYNQVWPIQEEFIHDVHPWKGRLLSDLWDDRTRMLIYYLPRHEDVDLVSAVLQGNRLQVGDRLIIATQPSIRTVQRTLHYKFLEFWAKVRQFQQRLQPTLTVLVALLFVIALSTVTYIINNYNTPIVDALYFSVGMITGAGGQERVAEQSDPSIKLFTVMMMLVRAGVIGICYALLNDFVLGSRFKQLWNSPRIPTRNHYIVCGLGGLGIQIVDQLHANGCSIVIIEKDPNNRFLHTAAALKIPVIQSDASLAATLVEAHIQTADALLASTSDDVANLEIALSAKGLAPRVPVIVRNQDPQFAPLAQAVFEFEAVLSPTELAAPSFAAAALGGRILGNGMTANTLWVALATMITPAHPFCGQQVKDVATSTDIVPLYIEGSQRAIHGWTLLDVHLCPGDVLYLTVQASKLEHLWRSQPNLTAHQEYLNQST
ncbi:MAG: NAD-binding protein [Synechococcales cyanobacterium T60_A2020_003]|nr:NAD-binding protein [Synechococcales cyanobacterium T60_A2020_003]